MPVYVLAISLLLVLACSRIPNPFSSVSALPIVRAARLAPTPTPLRYSQSLFATGTGQRSGQASANGGTELDENSILGPVNPAMVLAAVLELTQTAIAAESVANILGGLATPLASIQALKTPTPLNAFLGQVTPTPSTKLPAPVELGPSPTPSLEEPRPTEEP
ncbi:MAG: hypothetical protein IIC83_10350, partial [Chloroflexi bacterium]|nr:hypothetical protein [Chloroflexota bacterium]